MQLDFTKRPSARSFYINNCLSLIMKFESWVFSFIIITFFFVHCRFTELRHPYTFHKYITYIEIGVYLLPISARGGVVEKIEITVVRRELLCQTLSIPLFRRLYYIHTHIHYTWYVTYLIVDVYCDSKMRKSTCLQDDRVGTAI